MAGRIIAASVSLGGLVCIGRRHGIIIQDLVKEGFEGRINQSQQGFVDEDGEHLDRKQAYYRAAENGRIKDDGGTPALLSEMLW